MTVVLMPSGVRFSLRRVGSRSRHRSWLVSCGGCKRFVEFFLGPGANFIEFSVQPSDLRVKFNEGQALRGDQAVCFHSGVILRPGGLQIDAGGGLLRSGIAIQIHKIQARSFHGAAIMA
jgi:hypothetical protein